ncbi:MAG: hypothetical protein JSS63_09220 [Bacteroidetes bacterium]|nr:hypothetical protein [Bacteroidota bacterium]
MKGSSSASNLSYKEFTLEIGKGKIPPNLILSSKNKVVTTLLLKSIALKFLETDKLTDENFKHYYADDKMFEDMMEESMNTSFFSSKKVLVYKNFKKFLKAERELFLRYLNDYNPDTMIILLANDFADIADNLADVTHANIKAINIKDFSDAELFSWMKDLFEGYEISDENINYFVSMSGSSVDELYNEAEKLKIFSYKEKKISKETINLCAGISRDFSEDDFLMAVLSKDFEKALKIYDKLSLQRDVEIYLMYLISTAFVGIAKLFDPASGTLGRDLKRILKLWFASDKLIGVLKEYKDSTTLPAVKGHLQRIFETDKLLKTSNPDKKNVITNLIFSLTNI